jgi:NAD(P)-dependent dehydrogenase (short-subunit alcohol dehydrogenase family)
MDGKTAVITGATSGIGEETALALARQGANLALTCRSRARGEATRTRIESTVGRACVRLYEADFERLDDIRNLARQLTNDFERIDVLHNNAGVTMLRREETVDGYEKTFAVNHLAPFLLTNLLLPRILETPDARIVNVASDAHRFAYFDIEDLQSTNRFSAMRVYGGSKLANILFTHELARRVEGADLRVWSLHPGAVATRLGANNGALAKIVLPVLALFFRTPEQGARTSIQLCSDAGLRAPNGTYFANGKPRKPSARALDTDLAARLWSESERLVGV